MNEIICNLISTLFLSCFVFLFFFFFFLYFIFWIRTVTPHLLLCNRREACKESTDETESIVIIFSAEINLFWRLNRVWVSIKLYIYIYIYIYIYVLRFNGVYWKSRILQNILIEEEKIQIKIYPDPEKLLNQKCDLIAKCRHRNEFKL